MKYACVLLIRHSDFVIRHFFSSLAVQFLSLCRPMAAVVNSAPATYNISHCNVFQNSPIPIPSNQKAINHETNENDERPLN
jgi:hypothetical protein